MRGMVDDKHYNFWEDWFRKAYEITEFTAFNTLWLSYFIAGGSLGQQNAQYAFKQVLQTVYTSNPDLVGVLFLASKCQTPLPAGPPRPIFIIISTEAAFSPICN